MICHCQELIQNVATEVREFGHAHKWKHANGKTLWVYASILGELQVTSEKQMILLVLDNYERRNHAMLAIEQYIMSDPSVYDFMTPVQASQSLYLTMGLN